MKDHNYWTFNQRYPLAAKNLTPAGRVRRFLDRIDDACIACRADLAFRRMEMAHKLRNHRPCSIHRVRSRTTENHQLKISA